MEKIKAILSTVVAMLLMTIITVVISIFSILMYPFRMFKKRKNSEKETEIDHSK